ncbi:hypothetical protein [Streptomyces sp. H39-C1]|uniref:hypothetical protein n=1 Tax=Streptomyces sp. H39-C1 TaxID=3004355 RepID=UPI0022AF054C|nr:hypothetical protein [Streptomyces sp. H39-C1]MCZ4101080.1 hypothetical protein [Streptomyces sp. H39-C1]
MTTIDELLARVLLLKEPDVPGDIVPHDDAYPSAPPDPVRLSWDSNEDPANGAAADNLQLLCDILVTMTAAISLRDFITDRLPAPSGAVVLGCILQLADDEDGARFWWQYAAGAGDDTASYCLYLHHLALGEVEAATWWCKQTRIDTQPIPTVTISQGPQLPDHLSLDSSTPTVLRVLGRLVNRAACSRTEVFTAVMDYVPSAVAVGYVDNPDIEIPLPGPHFAEHIGIILTAASAISDGPHRTTTDFLPARHSESPRAEPALSKDAVHGGSRWRVRAGSRDDLPIRKSATSARSQPKVRPASETGPVKLVCHFA